MNKSKTKDSLKSIKESLWLRWQDLNLRMLGPKPSALPLGYTPLINLYKYRICKINKNYNYKNMAIIVI